jgi:alanine dehydrogenase
MALYLSAVEARKLLGIADSLRIVEQAFRDYGRERIVSSVPSASYMLVQNDAPTMFWIKSASLRPLGAAGVFFGAQFGDYYFMVTDSRTGMLRGIVEQAWLTKRRTATAGVVAARKLAAPKARVAALIGAGQIGEEVARVLPHAFQLDDFRVASRTPEGAKAFVERLKADVDAPLRAVASAEEAIRGADVVITITLASEAFVKPGWLKEGAVLVSMGGVPEVEFGVLAEIDRVIVDDPDYALLKGDLATWVDRGEISLQAMKDRIDADLGEVMCGAKEGRRTVSQRILAVVQGMAVCDLATAVFILDKAQAEGAGQHIAVTPQMEIPALDKMQARAEAIASGLQRRRPGPAASE